MEQAGTFSLKSLLGLLGGGAIAAVALTLLVLALLNIFI